MPHLDCERQMSQRIVMDHLLTNIQVVLRWSNFQLGWVEAEEESQTCPTLIVRDTCMSQSIEVPCPRSYSWHFCPQTLVGSSLVSALCPHLSS